MNKNEFDDCEINAVGIVLIIAMCLIGYVCVLSIFTWFVANGICYLFGLGSVSFAKSILAALILCGIKIVYTLLFGDTNEKD